MAVKQHYLAEAFHYVERGRSRALIELLTQMRLIGQQATAEAVTRHLKEQQDIWHNLQQLWREMEPQAGEYVALRRGRPLTWPALQSHLQLQLRR